MANSPWEDVTVWHELMSMDPQRAEAFYQEVIGLKAAPLEGGPFPYIVWMRDEEPVGGLIPPQDGQKGWPSGTKPHWVSSFATADVDKAVEKAQKLGGQVLVPPIDIPQFGRAAVLKDPEGAVFGIFQKRT
ncbi:MAG: VOC family protein [Chloroflexi bacterium]|nr:MAG: VOC family protein [Chloroflexota bacterium]